MAVDIVQPLMRVIRLRGRKVIESLLLGEYDTVSTQGGGKLVSTSIGGKSFSFQVPSNLSADALMVACEETLRLWDSMDADQRDAYFTVRRQKKTVATFGYAR
jgi:hypothetical protein